MHALDLFCGGAAAIGRSEVNDLFQEQKATLRVHPVAELFPMMSEEELAELAADIKANGQVHPILLDHEGAVIDGRNRLRACELAGVEPAFARVEQPIADPVAYVVSLNVKRRNLTASQKAIAAAEAWVMAEAEGRVQKHGGDRKSKPQNGVLIIKFPSEHFGALFSVGKNYVDMAKALLAEDGDPTNAVQIKKGGPNAPKLKDTYDAMMKRRGGDSHKLIALRKLKETRPDLVEKVEAEEITLDEAEREAKKDADDRKQQRWALTMNLLDSVKGLDRPTETVAEIAAGYDPAQAESRGENLSPDRLRKVAAFAAALADAIEENQP
jgi:hypothetical protein